MSARILVIDDEDAYRRICVLALKSAGYEVVAARDGGDGLRVLEQQEQQRQPVAVVLTDILMPDTEGVTTIATLRRQFPHVRVLAMSGGGTIAAEECLRLARAVGAAGVLRKPFTMDELLESVQGALQATTEPVGEAQETQNG